MVDYPFQQLNTEFELEVIRIFKQSLDSEELLWHYDLEDRIIEAMTDTDWMIQIDNKLPESLNSTIVIEKGVYHRLIKGTGDLKIKIIKCQ